jgi:hypothetical protein
MLAIRYLRKNAKGTSVKSRLGFRTLMDVIPLDASLVRGSHGYQPSATNQWPVLLSFRPDRIPGPILNSTDVFTVLKPTFRTCQM